LRAETALLRDQPADARRAIEAATPVAEAMPSPARVAALRQSGPPLVWAFADLFASHAKSLVLLQLPGYAEWLPDADLADFNRIGYPHVRIVRLQIPPEWMFDNVHVTADGARAVASVLEQERQQFLGQPR
jgi:lysophospholipase L1-like esterase